MKDKNLLKVEITFFLCGALISILFVWLVSVPTTIDFWFFRGNEFSIPRVQYWLVFGTLFTFGLALSYCICVWRSWLTFGHWTKSRAILATLILLVAFLSGDITASRFIGLLDPAIAYFLVCLVIVSLISVALWLFTLSWKTWPAIFLLLAIPVAYILTIGLYRSLDLSNLAYDILRMMFIGGLLSSISGYWLATPRIFREGPSHVTRPDGSSIG